jgi:hypothetical protein
MITGLDQGLRRAKIFFDTPILVSSRLDNATTIEMLANPEEA